MFRRFSMEIVMAVVDIKEAQSLNGTHVLHSKANFDTVKDVKRKKAEIAVSAVSNKTGNLTTKSQLNGNSYTPIIAESSNFRKEIDRKSTRLNSSHIQKSRMPSSA